MEEVHATRTELLARKNQMALAKQGCDLLKEKRDALVIEFMRIMNKVLETSRKLQEVARKSAYAMTVAKAVDGVTTIRSAALATKSEVTVEISGSYVMGVPVPEVQKRRIHRSALERGYGILSVSSRIDEAAERYEQEVNLILDTAANETRMKRLGDEIQRTRRRVNALERVVIPSLNQQVHYIQMALDERAREDLFRLKKVKKTLEGKKKASLSE